MNLGVSRNRFCDFLADPGSRNFSRFYTNIARSRYALFAELMRDFILGMIAGLMASISAAMDSNDQEVQLKMRSLIIW